MTINDLDAMGRVELESAEDAYREFLSTPTKQAKAEYLHDFIEAFGESIMVEWMADIPGKSLGVLREEAKQAGLAAHGTKKLLHLRLGLFAYRGYDDTRQGMGCETDSDSDTSLTDYF
eukprot:scaffold3909_cov231-Pinguiococcus_pyrenoidosus.AAC.2